MNTGAYSHTWVIIGANFSGIEVILASTIILNIHFLKYVELIFFRNFQLLFSSYERHLMVVEVGKHLHRNVACLRSQNLIPFAYIESSSYGTFIFSKPNCVTLHLDDLLFDKNDTSRR